jgi:hypothetical protein
MRVYIICIASVLAIVCSCKTGTASKNATAADKDKASAAIVANDTVRIANDSLEYEIIIIDPGFNSWMYSRAKPRGYYGQPYLEGRNRPWVSEWNNRAMNPQRYGDLYQMRIDYDFQTNYGYEVNYMLYNYLVYFQQANNQRLGTFSVHD